MSTRGTSNHHLNVLDVIVRIEVHVRLRGALDHDRQAERHEHRRGDEADVNPDAGERGRRRSSGRPSTIANACATVSAFSPARRGMIRSDRYVMPSAASPSTSSGCREFFRVIRLSVASTADRRRDPAPTAPPCPGTPRTGTPLDDHPGKKRADRERHAGGQRDEVRPHPRTEHPTNAHFRECTIRGITPCCP